MLMLITILGLLAIMIAVFIIYCRLVVNRVEPNYKALFYVVVILVIEVAILIGGMHLCNLVGGVK